MVDRCSMMSMEPTLCRVMLSLLLATLLPLASPDEHEMPSKENVPHSRQKRILWITNDGRLALPPGTTMAITPSLSMPLVRHPLEGFLSNVTISFPFTIDFDKLGLTDNENPYGTLPPIFDRSFGRTAGSIVADYLGQYLDRRRGKREMDASKVPRELETAILSSMHGGERVILYGMAEDLLSNLGWSGRACILRAICEVHTHPLTNFGFLGELLKLFFTPSRSPYAHLLEEHTAAERAGQEGRECFPYFKDCPRSIFLPSKNKYSKDAEALHRSQAETEINEIRAM